MELIESRKAYIEGYGNPLGLLFVKKDQSKSPVFFSHNITDNKVRHFVMGDFFS